MFVDLANNDLHLKPGSPGINSGNPDARYNDPDGTRNTRGAYGGPSVNTPPKSDFSIYPPQGDLNTIFNFDASLSHDAESKDEELEVRWDIDGDGVYDTQFSANKIFMYQYNVPGTYNVTLQVKDGGGFISTIKKTVVINDLYPYVPSNPTPTDGAQNRAINVVLTWDGGGASIADVVSYDVYFGKISDPELISSDQTDAFFSPGILEYNSTYYWKLVGKDKNGKQSFGKAWSFTTNSEPVPPSPTNVSAEVLSSSEIRLNWSDSSGEKLGFIVERKEGENGIYSQIKAIEKSAATHTDTSLTPGTVYYYRVAAYNTSGNSPYSNEIKVTTSYAPGSFFLILNAGWNLISLPLSPSDTAIGTVLSNISGKYSIVWAYSNGGWKGYDPSDAEGSDLVTMEAGKGYWIKMKSAETLSISGSTPSTLISLLEGWNLIGYNKTTTASSSALLSAILSKCKIVWAYRVCDKFMGNKFTQLPYTPKNLPSGCSEYCSVGR